MISFQKIENGPFTLVDHKDVLQNSFPDFEFNL